tara:strand:+ start:3081 stop:3659 length:579 start_codon:yes stop_codon:yes gene_type:complete
MIIEIFGLPGSGKSTLVSRIKDRGDISIVTLNAKREILYYTLRSFQHIVFKCVDLLIALLSFTQPTLFWNTFFIRSSKLYKAKKGVGTKVIEEGSHQNTLSHTRILRFKPLLQLYLYLLPKPDKVLILHITEEERQKNLEKRVWRSDVAKPGRTDSMQKIHKLLLELTEHDSRYVVVSSVEEAEVYFHEYES